MEKLKFIGKIYTKFIINYIIISFIIMYLLRYLIVIVQSSIKNNTLHNPFLTTFHTLNDSNDENLTNEYLLTYFDPLTNLIKKDFVTKNFYENIKNLNYDENNTFNLKLNNNIIINTKNILKIEKIPQTSNYNTIIKKIGLPLTEVQKKHIHLIQEIYEDKIFNIIFFFRFNHLYI